MTGQQNARNANRRIVKDATAMVLNQELRAGRDCIHRQVLRNRVERALAGVNLRAPGGGLTGAFSQGFREALRRLEERGAIQKEDDRILILREYAVGGT